MLMNRADNRGHENLLPQVRQYSEMSVEFHGRHCRFLRFVDTHQKWLLLHLIADTCGNADNADSMHGAAANWICDRASEFGIASRNTSLAFFNQLAAYGYLAKEECRGDRRIRLVSLADCAEAVMLDWTRLIVESATGEETCSLGNNCLRRIYLDIAASLLADSKWMKPPVDVSLTQDMRGGWLVMSEILRHLPVEATGEAWVPALRLNIPDMSRHFGLSRSTLYRLVRLSIEAGTMAWDEKNAISTLSVNLYHLRQFCRWIGRLHDAAMSAHARHAAGAEAEPLSLDLPSLDGIGYPANKADAISCR
jgi:AraC-like DNA-binding protein